MAALIEAEARPASPFDLAKISLQLAEDVSRLVPDSDGYSVEDYFKLDGPYLVEYVDGCLQVLPMPDTFHQAIVRVLCVLLENWLKGDQAARVVNSPFKVFLDGNRYREPDIAMMLGANAHRRDRRFWRGADLAVEVISETNREHDVVTKMIDYAAAAIPEYWIVDPEAKSISVFVLLDGKYLEIESKEFVQSRVMPGFALNVAEMFAAAEKKA